MVEDVLRAVEPGLPVRLVHAVRGKGARAEPVAALFEARRCLFAGSFPELEDELTAITAEGHSGRSPDRADAMVWALTELMLRAPAEPRVRGLCRGRPLTANRGRRPLHRSSSGPPPLQMQGRKAGPFGVL